MMTVTRVIRPRDNMRWLRGSRIKPTDQKRCGHRLGADLSGRQHRSQTAEAVEQKTATGSFEVFMA